MKAVVRLEKQWGKAASHIADPSSSKNPKIRATIAQTRLRSRSIAKTATKIDTNAIAP
jgi:hypothetical protein